MVVMAVTLGSLLVCSAVLLVSIFVLAKTLCRVVAVQLGSLTIKQASYGADGSFTDVADALRNVLRPSRYSRARVISGSGSVSLLNVSHQSETLPRRSLHDVPNDS
jgi:hypothetical protein